ncbi:MAG: 2Fe-2S iron-sulfur cluster binding domain-containing protein, partial [Chloroflexi bacterium]|nr:2Fe-2S iron-sulfur cluster binding domain-containing protein [Chloroflexota bacterium]
MPSGRRAHVEAGTTLLDAARQIGVEIESICGGRLTCGKCKVRIEEGDFSKHGIHSSSQHLSPASAEEQVWLEQFGESDVRLACGARVYGDVLVFVPEESRSHKQIVRKSATTRLIEIDPTIRQFYVVVEEARLGEHRGDWGRLQDALAQQWDLHDLRIDLPVLQRLQTALRRQNWTVTV